ncbi:MAG: ACP S-malonyltransferase [Bacteriovoracaceae bacterium]
MKKVTLVFPGQGSQYVGMGKNFTNDAEVGHLFHDANSALGYDLKSMMLEGPESDLKLTQNTQPAIVTHSILLLQKLKSILAQKNITVERVLGHSVGEYSALVAAGSLTFQDAVKAVHFRGKYMQEAAPVGIGTMYAILKQPEDIIREACALSSSEMDQVSPANFNEPNQIVISGDKVACERAIKWMEEKTGGRVKAIELQVSAPFHCALMKPAEIKLKTVLDNIKFQDLTIPYVANIDAFEYAVATSEKTLRENLLKQVCGSVLWTQSIGKLASSTVVIEVGPGKVLAGLIKKINPEIKVISLDTETAMTELESL